MFRGNSKIEARILNGLKEQKRFISIVAFFWLVQMYLPTYPNFIQRTTRLRSLYQTEYRSNAMLLPLYASGYMGPRFAKIRPLYGGCIHMGYQVLQLFVLAQLYVQFVIML